MVTISHRLTVFLAPYAMFGMLMGNDRPHGAFGRAIGLGHRIECLTGLNLDIDGQWLTKAWHGLRIGSVCKTVEQACFNDAQSFVPLLEKERAVLVERVAAAAHRGTRQTRPASIQ